MALDFAKKKRLEVVVISDVSAQEFPCFGFVTSLANAYTFCVGFAFPGRIFKASLTGSPRRPKKEIQPSHRKNRYVLRVLCGTHSGNCSMPVSDLYKFADL